MNETEVVRELSRRTSVPEATAGAVFYAVRQMVEEGAIDERLLRQESIAVGNGVSYPRPVAANVVPISHADPSLVDDLIARARKHPLGLTFLLTGFLGSVAIALGAHAFTVEAARERLRRELQLKNESKEPFEA